MKNSIPFRLVSIVIPARNEGADIQKVVQSALSQFSENARVEVIVVDGGSTDKTVDQATKAGAIVISLPQRVEGFNPAVPRNHGARIAKGDPIIFLDGDCIPAKGWLKAILNAHASGAGIVGGSIALPKGLPMSARCDYYCSSYLVHPKRPAGHVPHHPPPNLSVRRDLFLGTSGFSENPPLSYSNEERAWQGELRETGSKIFFQPRAVVFHYNHSGLGHLLRRNYRWAYTAIQSKAQSGSARLAWLYRFPRLLIAFSVPLVFIHTFYIVGCWLRAGVWMPLLFLPGIFVSRFAYLAGMTAGGIQWLREKSHRNI